MSVLVVGVSHSTAPMATLERAVLTGDAQVKLLADVCQSESVAGSLVLSTCNRVEVYADVDRFHGGVAAICELLARHSGLPLGELTRSAYVHYEDRAVQHMLAVACGLESMVVGESQILGQVREAVRLARQHGTLSRELSDLATAALRTGKRAHAETGIDSAGQSLVSLGIELAAREIGSAAGQPPLSGLAVLVVGAGSMSSLATATAVRAGAGPVVIANRTRRSAERLAARFDAAAIGLAELPSALTAADVVIACTGAPGHVISADMAVQAAMSRNGRGQILVDLALPRDVEEGAGQIDGVTLIDLGTMGASGAAGTAAVTAAAPTTAAPATAASGTTASGGQGALAAAVQTPAAGFAPASEVTAVRRIVAAELAAYLQAHRAATVAPTVVALRAKAATVVESELARLERRLGDLDVRSRREIAQAMGRIADKLLHGPTVRVKELAGTPGADTYETALRVLFELDPATISAVSRPDDLLSAPPDQGGDR